MTDQNIKALTEKALSSEDIIEGKCLIDEDATISYIKARIIIETLNNKGYLDYFDIDPLNVQTKSHSALIIWSDKAGDGNLRSKLISELLTCFEGILIDGAKWFLTTKIYKDNKSQ